MTEDSYPLHWPFGVPRTDPVRRSRAKFSYRSASRSREQMTTAGALDRLRSELRRFGCDLDRVVVSTNLNPGLSVSKAREPQDPGVAVYFELDDERRCVASDKWDRVADNITGIAAAIEALRGLERWVNDANVRAAFKGFAALPDPSRVDWRAIFGLKNGDATAERVQERYRELAFERHPDRGGTDQMMAELNSARTQALAELKP